MTLRVCHLAKYYPPMRGGMEQHVQTLARAQQASGLEVSVLCVNHQDVTGRDVHEVAVARARTRVDDDAGVRVVRVGRVGVVARAEVALTLPFALRAELRRGVDLVHLHAPNPIMSAVLVGLRVRVPLVVTYHADVSRQKVLARLLWPMDQWIYRHARAVIANAAVYAQGSGWLTRTSEKQRVVPLGIPLGAYERPSARSLEFEQLLRARHPGPLWLAVGRLVSYKGLDVAIDALPDVAGILLIVGTGVLRETLEARARARGVAERVVFAGSLDEDALVGAYRAATALWFPSNTRAEAFGLVQVEAMAAGCPVINAAIPHSGVAWVGLDDVAALTVPVNDPGALAQAANRLLSEPGLRERLAAGARLRARTEFDSEVMNRRIQALYRELLGGGASAWDPPVNASS